MTRFVILLMSILLLSCAGGVALALETGHHLRGDVIAFQSWREGNAEIYLIDRNTRALHNLTNHRAHDTGPLWSPDGSRLAFVSQRDGNQRLWVAEFGGTIYPITPPDAMRNGAAGEMAWTADSQRVLYVWTEGIQRVVMSANAATGTLYLLSEDDPDTQDFLEYLLQFWSGEYFAPDGTGSQRFALIEQINGRWWLTLREPNSEMNIPLAPLNSEAVFNGITPTWSPDGSHIAYSNTFGRFMELFIIETKAGATPQQLTLRGGVSPVWRP